LKGEAEYKGSVPVSLKVKVAQDFLDREGHGKVTKVAQTSTVTVLDAARIEELKQRRMMMLSNLAKPVLIEDAISV
jgi:hypothetical protein